MVDSGDEEIEDVAEPLDDSVDGEIDCPESPVDQRKLKVFNNDTEQIRGSVFFGIFCSYFSTPATAAISNIKDDINIFQIIFLRMKTRSMLAHFLSMLLLRLSMIKLKNELIKLI